MDLEPLRAKLIADRDLDIGFLTQEKVAGVLTSRMEAAGVSSVLEYAHYLDGHPAEYQSLLPEILDPPHRFFGDPALASILESQILPSILSRKLFGDSIRIWVPHCGEGHVVYDVAVLIWRLLQGMSDKYSITILGTDTDETVINTARHLSDSPEGTDALSKAGAPVRASALGPRLADEVRHSIVFGIHDPIDRPPYPSIDLIICRGYLPLLDRIQRGRVKSKFVYSLVVGGMLMTGRGEILGLQSEEATDDRPFAVFIKRVVHPYELRAGSSMMPAAVEVHESFLDGLHVPALILEPTGMVTYANAEAEKNLPRDGRLVGEDLSFVQDSELLSGIANATREAHLTSLAVTIEETDGWVGAAHPFKGSPGIPRAIVVVLMPATACDRLTQRVRRVCLSTLEETALQTAQVAIDMRDYDSEVKQLQKQAAIVAEGLYSRTEELNKLKDILETRNTELQVINEKLRDVVLDRERAEREVRQAYEREHHIAQTLQKALLTPIPDTIDGFAFASSYQAAFEEADIGGDFFHGGWLPGGEYHLALGDVSGKGLEAAVYAYMTKYMMLGFSAETPEPDKMLARLNDALVLYGTEARFVTLAYLRLHLKSHTVCYASAGHEPGIYLAQPGGDVTLLEPTGMALGVKPGVEFGVRTLQMDPGAIMLLYTDGLSDAGPRNNPLGENGIAEIVKQHAGESPSEILRILYDTAVRISGGKLSDDAASILIKRQPTSSRQHP